MTFYFYDLETSGFDPCFDRIMQFAGQRTDADFQPLGDPLAVHVTLTNDVLPDPGAVLVTGITPQKTIEEGYSEHDFLEQFSSHALTPETCLLGYNTIRFDDHFMRYTLFRNFHDPYEWAYKDKRSRWDLLDVVHMTRALRPEGVEWPYDSDGKPRNRLEDIARLNNLGHDSAHDALSDVMATIELARLLKQAQPKLFNYLLNARKKPVVEAMLKKNEPLVHSSGKISSEFFKTSVVVPIAPHPERASETLVYDLRFDPTQFADLDPTELARRLFTKQAEMDEDRLPVKSVSVAHAPALAPLGVLDEAAQGRIKLDIKTVQEHKRRLSKLKGFAEHVHEAYKLSEPVTPANRDVEASLYSGGFFDSYDKGLIQRIRGLNPEELARTTPEFHDGRLNELLIRYKARNFPRSLSDADRSKWEEYRTARLSGNLHGARSLTQYFSALQSLSAEVTDPQKQFLLEELKLYGESLVPEEV